MDIKQIIQWSLRHWWWFAISVVVCVLLGGVYYYTTTPSYEVKAVLMLRQSSDRNVDELMRLRGLNENKETGDEVEVLSSRDLMGRVVDSLHLTTTYAKLRHGKKDELFPSEFVVTLPDTLRLRTIITLKVQDNGYRITVKPNTKWAERFTVKDLSEPILTQVGPIYLSLPASVKKGTYQAVFCTRASIIEGVLASINIKRLSKESKVITLTSTTTTPRCMEATINTLLGMYNQEATADKNMVAIQTERFLSSRIAILEQELNEAEAAVETYKRTHQIANLSKTADNYQNLSENYERQVAEIDANLNVLSYILEQIDKPENAYAMIPGNMLSSNATLSNLISDYNAQIAHRTQLLQTATEQNLAIVKENEVLAQKRQGVKEGMLQDRQTLLMRRQTVLKQQKQYTGRLASLPETERCYVEMCREKDTKEKQYIYLIEQREGNAMQLSADAVPARIVEQAQSGVSQVAPIPYKVGFMSILLGLMLPLLVYFFGIFRKEYL